jgi:hypothetical protein
MAHDTRSFGEARHAGPAFPAFSRAAPQGLLQQASIACDTRSFCGVPLPVPHGLATTRARGGEQGSATPLETRPPPERSCVEAVLDYLEGPLATEDFDFMFVDEAGRVPQVGAVLDADDLVSFNGYLDPVRCEEEAM